MSGSPVYIDGKLMGAIAYAWSFAKEPLGGVTPIETMLAERSRPRRVKEETLGRARGDAARHAPAPASRNGAGRDVRVGRRAGWACRRLPAAQRRASRGGSIRASVPLSVAGFTPRTIGRAGTGAAALRAGAAAGGRRAQRGPRGRGTSSRARRSASSWCAAT